MKKNGAVDEDTCQEIIDNGVPNDIRPRHNLLDPAKLLAHFEDLINPRKRNWQSRPSVNVNVTLQKRERGSLEEFSPLWALTEQSAKAGLPDVGLCRDGLVVRMEGNYYVLSPPEIYVAIAHAFGLVLEEPPKPPPPKPPEWMMRHFGEDPDG